MASITFQESGSDATGDLAFFSATTGTVASDATVSHTGPRSIKLSTGSPATGATASRSGVLADAGRRISVWFRTDVALVAATSNILILLTSGALNVAIVNLRTDGKLTMSPTGATSVIGNTVLAANTWYRITLSYTITNTTTFKFVLSLNGVIEATATAGTLTRVGTSLFRLQASSTVGTNVNHWFDDIYIDDGSDYTDPGNIRVTAKKPASNNTNNFDTSIGANPANRWTNVNEVPISINFGWEEAAIADVQENYGLEAATDGDVNIATVRILGRTAWLWGKISATTGSPTPKIMDNGTETAIVLTTSAALYTVITTSSAYPSNAAGIGMRSSNTAGDTFLYDCGTIISYLARRRVHVT